MSNEEEAGEWKEAVGEEREQQDLGELEDGAARRPEMNAERSFDSGRAACRHQLGSKLGENCVFLSGCLSVDIYFFWSLCLV